MRTKQYDKDFFDYIKPFTAGFVKPIIDFIYRKPVYAVIILIVFIYSLLFLDVVLKAFIVSFLILLGGISKIYQRYTHLPIGIELVMFSTVIAGHLYGSLVGGLVGFGSFALATHFSVRYTTYVIPSFIIYILAGVLTPFFNNVAVAGILFTTVFVVVLSYISIGFLLSKVHRVAMFAFTSFSWNLWIFLTIAPRIVGQ